MDSTETALVNSASAGKAARARSLFWFNVGAVIWVLLVALNALPTEQSHLWSVVLSICEWGDGFAMGVCAMTASGFVLARPKPD